MKRIKHLYYWIAVVFFGLIIAYCVTIDGVTQPETATVGEEITITVDATATTADHSGRRRLIFGILVPKSWNVRENASVRFDSDWEGGTQPAYPGYGDMFLDDGTMATNYQKSRVDDVESGNTWEVDAGIYAGFGENYGLVEWVVFISDQVRVESGEVIPGTITVTLTVGDGHTGAQLGYFLCSERPGFQEGDWGTFWPDCIAITGASPGSTDLCAPEPVNTIAFQPDKFSYNDLITIKFDSKIGKDGDSTDLVGASEVYLCINATYTGGTSQLCDNSSALHMTAMGDEIWEIMIWPRGLLDIPGDADISEIGFSFKNGDGSIEVKHPISGEDFLVIPNCN